MSKRLEMLEAALAKGSEDPFVWYAHAMELRGLERLEDALERFGEICAKFPDYVPTYLMAGQVAEELGRIDEARRYLGEGRERAIAAGDQHAASEISSALESLE